MISKHDRLLWVEWTQYQVGDANVHRRLRVFIVTEGL